jgi:UDP-N-acetylglucosamine--N-acetylmuramyl-(pentapeptide) pyrophosphoryl-undecaprenol N-acetylglucosamine transferase
LAVAERLRDDLRRGRVTFVGSGRPFERRHVADAGFEYLSLPCRPLPRRLRDLYPFVADNFHGYCEAGKFLGREQVSIVVGLGGYGSVPTSRAAIRRGVPLILLEQNAVPGRATRWLAPRATLVCTAFEQANRYLGSRCPVRVTGNPIRSRFAYELAVRGRSARDNGEPARSAASSRLTSDNHRSKVLLVLGGSSGARSLNQHVPRALAKVGPGLRGWKIAHQTGSADLAPTRRLYRKLGLKAIVVPFITEMPRVLARTDLAVCRAGGTTLAELAATGVPAILVPYPHATDDHQRRNADVFTASGASLTLDERDLPGRLDDHLAGAVALLFGNPAQRAAMSRAVRRLAQPDAAWDVATMIRQVAACRAVPAARVG